MSWADGFRRCSGGRGKTWPENAYKPAFEGATHDRFAAPLAEAVRPCPCDSRAFARTCSAGRGRGRRQNQPLQPAHGRLCGWSPALFLAGLDGTPRLSHADRHLQAAGARGMAPLHHLQRLANAAFDLLSRRLCDPRLLRDEISRKPRFSRLRAAAPLKRGGPLFARAQIRQRQHRDQDHLLAGTPASRDRQFRASPPATTLVASALRASSRGGGMGLRASGAADYGGDDGDVEVGTDLLVDLARRWRLWLYRPRARRRADLQDSVLYLPRSLHRDPDPGHQRWPAHLLRLGRNVLPR